MSTLLSCCDTTQYSDNCILQFGVLKYPCPNACLYTNPVLYYSVQQYVPSPCPVFEEVEFTVTADDAYSIPAGATGITITASAEATVTLSGGPFSGDVVAGSDQVLSFDGPFDSDLVVTATTDGSAVITYTICF